MSKENVQKFNEFMTQNIEAQKELDELITAATIEFAASKGFEFTTEDVADADLELSPEDLDNVSGGYLLGPEIIRELKRKKGK